MKTPFNFLQKVSAISVLGILLFAALPASAALPVTSTATATRDASFCASFSGFSANALSRISLAKANVNNSRADLISKLQDRQNQSDQALVSARANENAAMKNLFGSLEALASTKAQKAAVKEFEKAVTDSIAIRTNIVDAAVTEYRNDLKAALLDQQSAVGAALTEFESDVTTSLAPAKSACLGSAQADPSIIALAKSGLKDARMKLAQKKAAADSDVALSALAAKRKLAILHADQDYHGALNAAKNTLKKSFPEAFASGTARTSAATSSPLN